MIFHIHHSVVRPIIDTMGKEGYILVVDPDAQPGVVGVLRNDALCRRVCLKETT